LITTLAGAASGERGVTVLELAAGSRALAMATTSTIDDPDPTTALLNPAFAAGAKAVVVNSSYSNLTGDVDVFSHTVAWRERGAAWSVAGALTHARIDFKTFDESLGFIPFNTQSSYMTATAAAARALGPLAVAAGASVAWSTSETDEDETLVDVGLRVGATALEAGRWRARFALAWSSLHNGARAMETAGPFAPGSAPEQFRYAASVVVARGEGLRVAASLAAVDAGQDGDADVTAGGGEVSVAGLVHARAGYGDGILGGRDAVTGGVGAGGRFGRFGVRLDYARVESTDGALAINAFGLRASLEF
jgi:hypothetical protein